jgi:glycosyltransferase involved in cell wall biosynthesis
MPQKRILLFDTITDGHHPDYLYNLMLYFGGKEGVELFIVTGEGFNSYLEQNNYNTDAAWKNVFIHVIPRVRLKAIHQKSIFVRSILEWNLMVEYAEQLGANKVLLMYMDYFQLGMIFGKKTPLDVSGIYFRPGFTHTSTSIYAHFKKCILQWAMNAGNLKNLFTLDAKISPALQQLSRKTNIIPLCEPIQRFEITDEEKREFATQYGISENKINFLVLGYLDERKGIEVFLNACKHLSADYLQKINLILAGPIDEEYRKELQDQFSQLEGLKTTGIWGYISYRQGQIAFDTTDWTLVLYQNHLGSSSVLARSAHSKAPVLGTQVGQIGELISEHHLGISVDTNNPLSIAKVLEDIIDQKMNINHDSIQKFANDNSVQAFGEKINYEL